MASEVAISKQYVLDLGIEMEREVNGVEMGVLDNGMPYLTQRGLAQITGASRKAIFDVSQEWAEQAGSEILPKGRMGFIREYLYRRGYSEPNLYVEIRKDGSIHYAYPDVVCMALLEYYAFEAATKLDKSVESYRQLASFGFQEFVYRALGYQPIDPWVYHQDRVSILKDSAPDGYFILFNEMGGMIVDLINSGLTVNSKTIPDISVGIAWGKHWELQGLDERFEQRIKIPHNYPDYFPQAASNPQPIWAYPDSSLAEFRRWFRHDYLTTKFPRYILSKANLLPGGNEEAERIAAIYESKELPVRR